MMSSSAKAAILLIFSVGLVISYPSITYPPLRNFFLKILRALVWPIWAVWQVGRWVVAAPGEWSRLQKELPELADVADGREQELMLAAGKMWLETQMFTHKPRLLIGKVDREHGELALVLQELRAKTFGRPVTEEPWFKRHSEAFRPPPLEIWWQIDLWFAWLVWQLLAAFFRLAYAIPRRIPRFRRRGIRWGRILRDEWRSLLDRQVALRRLIEKVPERTKIYDRLQSAKEVKRRQRKELQELLRPMKGIEAEFEGAKGYIRRLKMRPRHTPTKGSEVLWLKDVIKVWEVRVQQIEQAQASDQDPELIMEAIRSLVRDMALAGTYAAKVLAVERRAQLIRRLHKRLRSRFRYVRLPEEEVKSITIIMREVVSQLWASGSWDELAEALDTVLEYIQIYEMAVLSRVWELQAGNFEQLVAKVFGTGYSPRRRQIRLNPQMDENSKRAADGSDELSPYAKKLRSHDNDLSSRYAKRGK
jgi:hypothetical protein